MLFKKKDFRKEILEALNNKDIDKVKNLCIKAFDNDSDNEELLGFVCGIIFENQILDLNNLLIEFRDKYPFSLYPIRVFIADLLTRVHKYDSATTEARFYLRTALDNKQLENSTNEMIKYYVGKAFFLLTCAYTMVGARQYSKNVLEFANTILLDKWNFTKWDNVYSEELKRLDEELENEENKEMNIKWNSFFKSGANANELFEFCTKNDFNDIAKRVDLIEGNFRFNPDFKVNILEIFMLVAEFDEKGQKGYLLK